jgi:biopolymer transport protein TolQ
MSESFSWPVRVYYEDTDTAGVVYYANYLKFMERARTEWLRSFGYEQDQLINQEDMIFVVRSVKLDYHRPALFNESLEVTATIKNMGKASIVFEQQVIRKSDQPECWSAARSSWPVLAIQLCGLGRCRNLSLRLSKVSSDMSILHLVSQASFVVQVVMFILVAASVISWTLIILKYRMIRRAKIEAEEFEDRFWSGADLGKLYERIRNKEDPSGMEHIFASGFRYLCTSLSSSKPQAGNNFTDTIHRTMRVSLSREIDALEHYLSFLATVGSISPYVGLFGTVWGIMNSFRSLGQMQQATLSVVAPGIAEALIATAIGLFAAIPAVIAYNRFSDDVERLVNRYDNFLEEFLTLLQRQALSRSQSTSTDTETTPDAA